MDNQDEAVTIAAAAVMPLLLKGEGEWIGDDDFPSGADYIDHITHFMEVEGLYTYVEQLQENGKTD